MPGIEIHHGIFQREKNMCTETLSPEATFFLGRHGRPAAGPSRSLKVLLQTQWSHSIVLWRERANQRRALLRLDERLLRDIGVSRAEAIAEARKPFWKP